MGGIPSDGEHIPILVGCKLLPAVCSKPQVPVSPHTEFGGVLEASDLCLYFSLCCCFWTQGSRQGLGQATCITSLLDCEQSQQRSRQTNLLCADLPVSLDTPPACGHSGGWELRIADQLAFCCSPSIAAWQWLSISGFSQDSQSPTMVPLWDPPQCGLPRGDGGRLCEPLPRQLQAEPWGAVLLQMALAFVFRCFRHNNCLYTCQDCKSNPSGSANGAQRTRPSTGSRRGGEVGGWPPECLL